MLLRLFGFYTRESRLLRGAKALHAAVQEPAKNPALYEGAVQLPRLGSTISLKRLSLVDQVSAELWQLTAGSCRGTQLLACRGVS